MNLFLNVPNTRFECESLKSKKGNDLHCKQRHDISLKRTTDRHEGALVPVNEGVHAMNNIPPIDHAHWKSFDNKNPIGAQRNQYLPLIQARVKA